MGSDTERSVLSIEFPSPGHPASPPIYRSGAFLLRISAFAGRLGSCPLDATDLAQAERHPFWRGYDYLRSRMTSKSPLDSTTIVASPRALLKASVPPRMPKCPTAPASGNAAKPQKMICPLSNTDLAPGSRTGRFFSYAALAIVMSILACAGVRYPTLEWRRCRL
jgi:hypothetical protein